MRTSLFSIVYVSATGETTFGPTSAKRDEAERLAQHGLKWSARTAVYRGQPGGEKVAEFIR